MSFSIANTSASAVITKISTPSSVTGTLSVTSGSLPLFAGGIVSGTNTTIDDQKGAPGGTFQMMLQQGDAKIDAYVNNTLYSSAKYSSGLIQVSTPILTSADSLTMAISDVDFDCYTLSAWQSGASNPEMMIEQPDGKIVYVGYFTSYGATAANRIIRLNADFSVDDTFVYGTGFNGDATALAIQSDGKLIVGGNFTQYNGTARNRMVRLNTDGSLDTSFGIGTGFNATVWSVLVQSDGKIVAAGDFATYSGSSRPGVIRLLSTGNIDTSFAAASAVDSTVYQVAQQSDGKILAGGLFTSYSGVSVGGLVRLTTAGIIDAAFPTSGVTAGGFNGIYSLDVLSDGKIMLAGNFTTYSGVSSRDIARINSDGTYDATFNVGSGFTGSDRFVLDVTETNGKYFVTGVFDNYNGTAVGGLVRLNSDGSVDTTFNTGTGIGTNLSSFGEPSLVLSNGNYNIVGTFSDYNGTTVPNMIVIDPFGKLLNCE
jgi:uncharacterized delta-60 repeat protein